MILTVTVCLTIIKLTTNHRCTQCSNCTILHINSAVDAESAEKDSKNS